MKQQVKLNEAQLKKIVAESVKKVLKEVQVNDWQDSPTNGSDYDEINIPDDVYEWGRKVQALGLELCRLCGQYRYTNEELYNILSSIEQEYNAVCGDLNAYNIAYHWST